MASRLVAALTIASSMAIAGSVAAPGAAVSPSVTPSFTDIACPSASSCFAVGLTVSGNSEKFESLVEHWNGTSWSIMPSPNAKAGGALSDVTCPTPTSCIAVGASGYGGAEQNKAFAVRWNGVKWSIAASPSPLGSVQSALQSVSCANPTTCFAVGSFNTSRGGALRPVIERWNGSDWSIVKSPSLSGGRAFVFSGVSCPSAKRCFAVGGSEYLEFPGAVVASWSGTTWSATDLGAPNYGPLTSVSCTSPSNCFAVGTEIGVSLEMKTVVERWNGTRWTRVSSPNFPQGYENLLADITCTSPKRCLTVGRASLAHQGPLYTYALRWDGKAWSSTKSLNPHSQNNGLSGVSCATPTNCFAVGFSSSFSVPAPIERWNGKSWSLSAHPDPTS